MKRKYLSALLMGALTVTTVSTFTSCKDYDSDISNLQGQIDKAALKTEVEAMKTTVEAAKTAAESAKTTAEKNATDLTDVKTKAEKLATQVAEALQTGKDAKAAADEAKDQCDELELKFYEYYTAEKVDALLDELEAKIDANTESIKDLKAEVESYSSNINKLYSAVTGVSLVLSEGLENSGELNFAVGNIATADGEDYTFGVKEIDDLKGEHSATPTYTYVNKAQFSRPNEILVRVNPVNATLTKDMIKFVDSKGGDLNNLVEVESVTKYDEYITKSRASETGLWKVQVNLKKPYKKNAVEQKIEAEGQERGGSKHIAYALAVNNTASQSAEGAEDRWVVSTYDLTVTGTSDYLPASNLTNVTVNGEAISTNASTETITDGEHATSVQSGDDIVVSFADADLKGKVDRFYVVRDDMHAKESGSSEYNAWTKYQYEGLNKIVAVENGVGKATLRVTIPSSAKAGDEIQFRIFAMNYDGTLVDADGTPFRVFVGEKTTTASVSGTAAIVGYQNMETEWLPISGTLKDNEAENASKLVDKTEVAFKNEDGEEIKLNVAFAKDATGTAASKDSEVKYVKFTLNESTKSDNQTINLWPNDGTLTAIIEDGNQPAFNSLSVSLKKSMPTAEEAIALVRNKLYSWTPGALSADSTYTAYMYPATGDSFDAASVTAAWNGTATYAYSFMTGAITGLKDETTGSGFSFKIAGVVDESTHLTKEITSDDKFAISLKDNDGSLAGLVDNKTPHASTIYYNFGKISSEETAYNVSPDADFVVPVETYKTVFACPLDENVQKFAWIELPTGYKKDATDEYVLTYSKVNEIAWGSNGVLEIITYDLNKVEEGTGKPIAQTTQLMDAIKATNSFNNKEFGLGMQTLIGTKYPSEAVTATLTTDDTGKADYFTVAVDQTDGKFTFTPTGASNPAADVPSTLTVKLTDAFGHTHVYKLPFTVKHQ